MAENESLALDLLDPEATQGLGAALARVAVAGDVIALEGDLGAGKSELARGFIRSVLGEDEEVPSPTFTLVQTYAFPMVEVWHFDLYRLEKPEDAFELDIEEAFGSAISLIEWPERLGPYLPKNRLTVHLTMAGEGRRAVLSGWGERLREVASYVGT